MPFQPYNGGGNDPLGQLLMLQQLKADQARQQEQREERATNMALDWIKSGGSVKDVRDYLYARGLTPAGEKMVMGAEKLMKQQQTQAQAESAFNSPLITQLGAAIAPIADASGKVGPTEQQRMGGSAGAIRGVTDLMGLAGFDPGVQAGVLNLANAAAQARTAESQEQVARERRAEAADMRSQSRSAGIASQGRREAEAIAMRGEERARLSNDVEEFTLNAAKMAAADPSAQPQLLAEAANRFGTDEARRIEMRMANLTGAAIATQQMTRKQAMEEARAKRDLALSEGKTASPRIASLAAEGKAGYDPTTGFYFQGNDAASIDRQSTLASLHEIQMQFEAAAKKFAEESGGKAYTGTLEQIRKQLGGNETPAFAAMDFLANRYQQRLLRLESGAAVPDQEVDRAKQNAPSVVQMNVQNGQLVGAARVRFAAQREDLESMFLSRFDRIDRAAVRDALREASRARIAAIESDPDSWYGELSRPTRAGQAALQELRGGGAPQPGAR